MYQAGMTAINTTDGTRGYVLNGYTTDATGWVQYEVATEYGIEVWDTSEMLVLP